MEHNLLSTVPFICDTIKGKALNSLSYGSLSMGWSWNIDAYPCGYLYSL